MVAALFHARKIWGSALRPLLFLLPVINIVEWGNLFKLYSINHSTGWIFNLVVHPAELVCFASVYYALITGSQARKWITWFSVLAGIFMIADAAFIQGVTSLDTYSYIFLCCILVLFSSLYFTQLVYGDNDLSLIRMPYYWFNLGVLLFFAGEAPLFAFFEYFLVTNNFNAFRSTFLIFSNLLNIIFYTLVIVSCFCFRKQQRLSLPA